MSPLNYSTRESRLDVIVNCGSSAIAKAVESAEEIKRQMFNMQGS